MKRMEKRKEKSRDKIRFWKGKVPKDIQKFYWDMFCEWKKYKVVKFHGVFLEDLAKKIEEI